MAELLFTELAGQPVALVPIFGVTETAIIDAADAPLVGPRAWSLDEGGYERTHVRRDGVDQRIPMHSLLLPVADGLTVDHRNRHRLDNRRANLRPATRADQQHNRGIGRNNSSGFKGVSWHRDRGRWRATIRVEGARRHLGLFDDPEEAARAYDVAALAAWGEWAGVNFPERIAS